MLSRTISVSKLENTIQIADAIENQGDTDSPLMLMYHINMGYPLLSENAKVEIRSNRVIPATDHAAEDLATWDQMLKSTHGFKEQCYFHEFEQDGYASIYNPDIKKGVKICFSTDTLPMMVQWKMMGVRDYVLGLEPRNCYGLSRKELRESGQLPMLSPGESKQYAVKVFFDEID